MTNPAWLDVATKLIGTREIEGAQHSPVVMGWIKRPTAKVLGITVKDDETAWCGTFVAHCFFAVGITPPPIAIRAMSWSTWGANLRADRLARGAVLVFQRPGGGHVGLYWGEDKEAYHVLGGNQGDAVSITRIGKARCVARRWPSNVPVTGTPVWLSATGTVSRNEV